MIKVTLEAWNHELVKSAVYRLERQFVGVRFTAVDAEQAIQAEAEEGVTAPTEAQLREAIHELLGGALKMAGRVKPQVIDRHRSDRSDQFSALPFTEEDVRGTAVPGVHWFGPSAQAMMTLLDEIFIGFAQRLGATPVSAPSLISQADLVKCGYLPKELHQVSFLSYRDRSEGPLESQDVCLSPAACLSTYPVHRGCTFEERTAFTLLGTVFRREGGQFSTLRPLERVWEYQVRELIFFGDLNFKEEVEAEYFRFLGKLGRRLDLSFEICSASDLFFHPEHSARAIHQLVNKTKFEFNFLGVDWKMALSSLNTHGPQFVRAFDIRGTKDDFQSFCIGFGLQRWVQALLSAHGSSERALEILRETINDEI